MQFSNLRPLAHIDFNIFKNTFLDQNRPFLIKNGAKNWPAVTKWNNEYLIKTLSNKEITIASSASKTFNLKVDLGDIIEQKIVKVPEAIKIICEDINTDRHHYILQQSINKQLPELLPDTPLLNWMDQTKDHLINFWFGQANNQSQLHFDSPNNIFIQVRGKKLVRLCSPKQSHLLYQVEGSMNHLSKILNLDNCDLNKYPKVAEAEFMEFILEPGDIMFIPTGWWHQVNSLDTTISVSFWWPATLKDCLLPNVIQFLPYVYKVNNFLNIEEIIDISSFSNDLRKVAIALFKLKKNWLAVLFCDAYIKKFKLNSLVTTDWESQVTIASNQSDEINELYCLDVLKTLENHSCTIKLNQ